MFTSRPRAENREDYARGVAHYGSPSVSAAAAIGCGMIVVDDHADAEQVTRIAPCSVLVRPG